YTAISHSFSRGGSATRRLISRNISTAMSARRLRSSSVMSSNKWVSIAFGFGFTSTIAERGSDVVVSSDRVAPLSLACCCSRSRITGPFSCFFGGVAEIIAGMSTGLFLGCTLRLVVAGDDGHSSPNVEAADPAGKQLVIGADLRLLQGAH